MTLAAITSSKADQEILDLAIVPSLGVPVFVEADMATTARDNDLHVR